MNTQAFMANAELLLQFAEDVQRVERVLDDMVGSDVDLVRQVGQHTLHAGGKRLRPAMVILAARSTGLDFDLVRADRLGACMELIHMATLIHDDVIDHAETRRGTATAAAIFGNTAAILTGDVLLAKAMSILAEDGDIEIIRTVSKAVVEVAEGEVAELAARGEFDITESDHVRILEMKTAAFIRCCCEVGAMLAGATTQTRSALAEYGQRIGVSFQVVDDLLDFRGDKEQTGKPIATDYREGCATLPLIYLQPHLSREEREFVSNRFGNGVTDDELLMISGWMLERGAFAEAEKFAIDQIGRAIKAVQILPSGPHRDTLSAIASYVLDRKG